MDFELPREIKAVQKETRRFARQEVLPRLKEDGFKRDLVSKMGEIGLFGSAFPDRYGGSNLGFLAHSGWYSEAVEGTFLSRFDWMPKLIVAIAVFLFVPLVAYTYGTVTRAMLKLIRME